MFQYGQISETPLYLEHRHADGSWSAMEREEGEEHSDPGQHDPERDWLRGHVYICRSCGERVRVSGPSEPAGEDAPA